MSCRILLDTRQKKNQDKDIGKGKRFLSLPKCGKSKWKEVGRKDARRCPTGRPGDDFYTRLEYL